jgi:hypothetical protein
MPARLRLQAWTKRLLYLGPGLPKVYPLTFTYTHLTPKSGSLHFLFVLLCLYCSTAYSQALDLNPPDCYSFEPVFKKDYVLKNKIHSIHAALVYKRDNEAIEDKGLSKVWEYDAEGFLRRYYATSVKGYVNKEVQHPAVYRRGRRVSGPYTTDVPVYAYDTTFTHFYYNKKKQLSIRRTQDGEYYNTVYYEYDSVGYLSKQSVFKETNSSENKNEFRVGVQNRLSMEEFRYQTLSATQRKRRHLNDEGKVYKETIFNTDSLGHLISENSSFTVSWMRSANTFVYDKAGRLIRKVYTSNENGDELAKSDYAYTSSNLVDTEKRYKGDVLYYELNYIYDRQNQMLNSYFIREDLNKAIVIVRLTYDSF